MSLTRLTGTAYALYAATAATLGLAWLSMGAADPGRSFFWLIVLALLLSMASIAVSLILVLVRVRRRAAMLSDVLSGRGTGAEIAPSDRMLNG